MMRSSTRWIWAGALISCLAAACGPAQTTDGGDASVDAIGHDAVVTDVPSDRGNNDVAIDTGTDSGTDTGTDAGTDAGGDVGKDVAADDVQTDTGPADTGAVDVTDVTTIDAGMDVGMDVAADVAPDVAPDVVADTPMDVPPTLCTGAINLNTAGTVVGTTTTYTGDNSTAPATAALLPMTCTTNTGAQVVHTYTSAARAALRISTVDTNTAIDTVALAVSSCTAGATEVGCNDDFTGTQSQFTTAVLPAGSTVVILIGGYGATAPDTGVYVLHVTEVPEVLLGATCDPAGTTNVCVTGSDCITAAGASTCVATGSAGGRCRSTGTACDAPNACNGAVTSAASRCVPVVAVGGTCDTTFATNVCDPTAHCLTSGGVSTCVADGALGGRCRSTGTACDTPNACNGAVTSTASRCVAVIALGGTCDPAGVTNVCATRSRCATSAGVSTCVPLPYVETTTPAMCDDLSTVGTPVPGVTGDDAASAIIALPFAYSYMGAAVDGYSVTTNGFMQVWTGATGTPSTAYSNAAIPTAATPNNYIAPFWDDMRITAPAVARTAVFGTAPNRYFVVEWNDIALFSVSGSVMRFQAKLFETTNVIEFHYCTLTPTTNVLTSGSSATVGLEDSTGAIGVQHSYNTAASVDTTNAIRFTP